MPEVNLVDDHLLERTISTVASINNFCSISTNITFYMLSVTHCASSLTPPANGTVNCTNGREVGSECFFSCFTDYEFYGSTTRICIDSGNTANWNGSETNCTGESIFICKQERMKRKENNQDA